jgi:hypothetical protein
MKKMQPGHADDSWIFSVKVNNSILDSTDGTIFGDQMPVAVTPDFASGAVASVGELSAPKGRLDASVGLNSCWRAETQR